MHLYKADLTESGISIRNYIYIYIFLNIGGWIVDHKNLRLETKLMFNILGWLYIHNPDSGFNFLSGPLNDTLPYDM